MTGARTSHDEPSSLGGSGPRLRFRKSDRLRKRREYLLVQQRGVRIHLADLLVFAYPNPGMQRVGITASSKVGGAVERNRIKRLIREVWRQERAALPVGHDLVFVAKRSATKLGFGELRRQFAELARRLSRLDGR